MTPLVVRADRPLLDEEQLAGIAFLAGDGGRTLGSYGQTCASTSSGVPDVDVAPLAATRTHIEVYRAWFGTVDGRSATVDGVRLLPVRPRGRVSRRSRGDGRA
jgi:hypothetical protein